MSKKPNCHSELVSESIKNKEYHAAGFRIKSGMTGSEEQKGRSMVEMLGVLAIIGVLSVAGIAGYTTAMRSYRTNEIVNAASMLYVMAMAKNQGNGDNTSYTEISDKKPSGVDSLNYDATAKTISIAFNDEDDCKMAKNKLGDKAPNDCSANGGKYTLTVNFGESVAEIIYPTYDYDEWEKGSCDDGYVFVDAPDPGCARILNEAIQYCQTFSTYGITSAEIASPRADYDPSIDPPWKYYFQCKN